MSSISTETNKNEMNNKRPNARVRGFLKWIVFILAVFVITRYVFPVIVCVGRSMQPNFYDSDFIIGSAIHGDLKKGDIIVFDHDGTNMLKRVVGLPGDVIDMDEETCEVKINGEVIVPANTQLIDPDNQTLLDNAVVPDGYVFVLGDNYAISEDSRCNSVGMVDEDSIICVMLLHLPLGDRPNK